VQASWTDARRLHGSLRWSCAVELLNVLGPTRGA